MTIYGPFHRKKSTTQTKSDAALQQASGEIWGRPVKNGGRFPCAKAYEKPLCFGMPAGSDCADSEGIEFSTSVKPTGRSPAGQIFWQMTNPPVAGLRMVDDETIALAVTISKVVYFE